MVSCENVAGLETTYGEFVVSTVTVWAWALYAMTRLITTNHGRRNEATEEAKQHNGFVGPGQGVLKFHGMAKHPPHERPKPPSAFRWNAVVLIGASFVIAVLPVALIAPATVALRAVVTSAAHDNRVSALELDTQ